MRMPVARWAFLPSTVAWALQAASGIPDSDLEEYGRPVYLTRSGEGGAYRKPVFVL
jgi:hypothetical protein